MDNNKKAQDRYQIPKELLELLIMQAYGNRYNAFQNPMMNLGLQPNTFPQQTNYGQPVFTLDHAQLLANYQGSSKNATPMFFQNNPSTPMYGLPVQNDYNIDTLLQGNLENTQNNKENNKNEQKNYKGRNTQPKDENKARQTEQYLVGTPSGMYTVQIKPIDGTYAKANQGNYHSRSQQKRSAYAGK